ncbi:Hypothetical predicted protein [Mytilus galloprovincialis]|uniref:Chitin-binding type-2 domain-containing protein n=1 Tax=Mytilus galloprovincialis TaxID=29158 RepID=A0A8B6E3F5_MYTGA|nr:Hypothetical predicted protein [Mytilus galloprovincialis]
MRFGIDKLTFIMIVVIAHFEDCNTNFQVPSQHFSINRDRRYVSGTAVIKSINTYSIISCASLCAISTTCCSASYSKETMICILSGVCVAETEPIDGVIVMTKTHQHGQTEAALGTEAQGGDLPGQTEAPPVTEAQEGDLPDCNTMVHGYLPYPNDCSSFIHCANSIAYKKDCPEGLHWNKINLYCDFPETAGCSSK